MNYTEKFLYHFISLLFILVVGITWWIIYNEWQNSNLQYGVMNFIGGCLLGWILQYAIVNFRTIINFIILVDRKSISKSNASDSKERIIGTGKESLSDKLDSEEFYNLMQKYRHSNMYDQIDVSMKFQDVKDWIRKNSQ